MNFKFTKGKVIWSIVIGFLVDLIYSIYYGFIVGCEGATCGFQIDVMINRIFSLPIIIKGIIAGLIIYILWSLFQKNKKRR